MNLFKLGSLVYRLLVYIVSPFHKKATLAVKGRQESFTKLLTFNSEHKTSDFVWFHCASYGEFEQGRPLLEAYKNRYPGKKLVLTFFSPSGYEAWKNYNTADLVIYLPFDSRKNAKSFVEILKPKEVFFIKYEFWPFYLEALKQKNIKTYLVSGIFRPNQLFFKGNLGKSILNSFTHFFLQDTVSKTLLKKLDLYNCTVTGDSRVDRVIQNRETPFSNKIVETFCGSSDILIAGSTWPKDNEKLIDFVSANNNWKLIIVPHELGPVQLENLSLKLSGIKHCFYSSFDQEARKNLKVLVLDTMGMLSKVYRFADICYIGGGFGKGIHNVLEPIIYEKPVIIGPNFNKFKEARDLVELGVIKSIENTKELNRAVNDFSEEKNKANVTSLIGSYIKENRGCVEKIMDIITK